MQHQRHAQKNLSQADYLILASLVQRPKHAIALQEAIEQTEGLVFEPGTLYHVLAQLEQRGWIEAHTTEHPLRLYQITARGLLAFQRAEVSRQGEQLRSIIKRNCNHLSNFRKIDLILCLTDA
jgi:DNA-binding PadR family transcriptional regulator